MKLSKLNITRLHNIYDYEVLFNDDVTFIYGANGCGKTTILNITEAIITGCLYKLFEYVFSKIILYYHDGEEKYFISIIYNDENSFNVIFEGEQYIIEKIDERNNDVRYGDDRTRRLRYEYFENFDVLKKNS